MNKESVDKYRVIKPTFEFPPDIIFSSEKTETDLMPLPIRTIQNSES